MNILVLNAILFTAENDIIPQVKTIKDTMIYNMCLGFKSLGCSVTLIAAEDYKPMIEEDYDFNVLFFKTKYKKLLKPSVLPYLSGLREYLKENRVKYDMILSSEIFSLLTLDAVRVCPDKLLVWQEMNILQKRFFKIPSKIWYNVVVPLFLRNVRVVTRSESANMFIRRYLKNVVKKPVEHGINVDKFQYSRNKKRYLISSSQLIKRKRVDSIIRKFAELHKIEKYKDIHLLIAGRGEMECELKQLVKDLGLVEFVDFLGFLSHSDLNRYVMSSLCFLINTRQDLNIVSIPEAIVSGTPVITNSLPASSSYIKAFDLGIVKDDWGVEELQNVIDNNDCYVDNCINYRSTLSNVTSAQALIDAFSMKDS